DRDRHRPEPTASSALDQSNTTRPSKEERRRRYKEVVERMKRDSTRNPELAKHTTVKIFFRDPVPLSETPNGEKRNKGSQTKGPREK
ncbi:MAG: hypothetical protein K9M96_19180, partial [Deltaproteobacteria bacterium]|nr:hypothetical protein [Deltaproteobacteria bacterium]